MRLDAGVRPGGIGIAVAHVVVREQRLLLLDGERLGGIVVRREGQVVVGIWDEHTPVDQPGLGQRQQRMMSAEDAAVHTDPGRHLDLVIDEQAVHFAEPLAVLVGHLDAVKAAVVRDLHVISFSRRACAGDPRATMPVIAYRGCWVSGLYPRSLPVRSVGPLISARALISQQSRHPPSATARHEAPGNTRSTKSYRPAVSVTGLGAATRTTAEPRTQALRSARGTAPDAVDSLTESTDVGAGTPASPGVG